MNRFNIFLTIIYICSAVLVGVFFIKNNDAKSSLAQELSTAKKDLASANTAFETEKAARENLEKKIAQARLNANFLSLALCPTIETTNKEALCFKDSAGWISEMLITGTAIPNAEVKEKIDLLLVALGNKTKPTTKQLYEMLKPIEVESLRILNENLQ